MNLLEEVARAIANAEGQDPNYTWVQKRSDGQEREIFKWEQYTAHAHQAISAMRTPDPRATKAFFGAYQKGATAEMSRFERGLNAYIDEVIGKDG